MPLVRYLLSDSEAGNGGDVIGEIGTGEISKKGTAVVIVLISEPVSAPLKFT